MNKEQRITWIANYGTAYQMKKNQRQTNLKTFCLKGRYTFGNFQRPVSSLGVSHYKHKITNLWKFELNWSSELRENDERKNTLVGQICVLSERNKRLEVFCYLSEKLPLLKKSMLLHREPFLTIFYTINSSPMLITKSVFKLIFVLSNYQTCTFPLV